MRLSAKMIAAGLAFVTVGGVLASTQWSYAGVKRRLFGPTCAEGLVRMTIAPGGQQTSQQDVANAACVRVASEKGRPVLVNLHQWSADFTEINAEVLRYAQDNDFNLITPNLHGPNDKPQACGSDDVVVGLDRAIDFMAEAGSAGDAKVVVIGVSGGGYTALHHVYRGQSRVDYYSIWVPITDLGTWHRQSSVRNLKYAQDIEKCTGLDEQELKKRSPLTYASAMDMPDKPILLAAGVMDGHGEFAVPISHSLNLFDVWANKTGGDQVSAIERSDLLTLNYQPASSTDPSRALLMGRAGKAQLLIFEGGHEILEDFALSEISRFLEPPAS